MKTIADALIEEGWQKGWHEGQARGLAEGQARGLAEGQAKGLAEGQAKGLAEAVLRLLSVRGLVVDERTRMDILSCKDLDLLNRWFEQAVTAKSLLELENL